jgi:cellulose synthase/poly-beta-1,6-N-acetylglucosamine synthase-like glycosyltransferase
MAGRRSLPECKNQDEFPEIAVLLPAHNEEKFIEKAVAGIFNSDYPKEKISLYIGSDGSTDKTDQIVRELAAQNKQIKFFAFERGGKNRTLNRLTKHINSPIIFYFDADCTIAPDAIKKMTSHLLDENTGAVLAALHSINADIDSIDAGEMGESMYQKYENKLKLSESKIFSTVASSGQFYAIKKDFYSDLPNPDVCDDLYHLLQIAKNKKRILYLPDAKVFEYRQKTSENEFKRRYRIIAGAHATVASTPEILLPKYGWYSFAFWSHKMIRYFSPFLMMLIAVATAFSYNNSYFIPLLLCQSVFYIWAFLGRVTDRTNIKIPLAGVIYYFVLQNIGVLTGFFKFLFSKNISIWENI